MNLHIPVSLGRNTRRLAVFLTLLAVSACKVIQVVEPGGIVTSNREERLDCVGGQTCVIDVENGSVYSETFTAVPDPGYVFVGWKKQRRSLCGGRLGPCVLQNVPGSLTDNDLELNLLAQFQPSALIPIDVEVVGLNGILVLRYGAYSLQIEQPGFYRFGTFENGVEYQLQIALQSAGINCSLSNHRGIIAGPDPILVRAKCVAQNNAPRVRGSSYLSKPFDRDRQYQLDAYDPEGYPLTISWRIVDQVEGGDLAIEVSDGGNTLGLTGSVLGEYRLEALVSDGTQEVLHQLLVEIVNQAPLVYTPQLSPEGATTVDPITATYSEPYDPEEVQLEVFHNWYINDVLQTSVTGSTLPAGVAKKGDSVRLVLRASDGVSESEASSSVLEIADAPMTLSLVGLPEDVTEGSPVAADVVVSDPDNDVELELAYGPEGMSLDSAGRLSWTARPLMFSSSETIHFGLRDSNNPADVRSFSLAVQDANRAFPIARSGIEVPRSNYSTWIGQYDEDDLVEILLTDGLTRVMTIEPYGDGYRQDWLYPFSFEEDMNLQQVVGDDFDGDGLSEIFVLSQFGVYLIENRNSRAITLYEAEERHSSNSLYSMAVANADADAEKELLVLSADGVLVIDVDSRSTELRISAPGLESTMVVGNVDNDVSLEVVLEEGYVYDLSTGANEWYFGAGFGNHTTLADVDGDGVKEIFGSSSWGPPTLYSAVLKSELWSFDNFNTCTVRAGNLDADAADELVVGDCQWGDIHAYNATLSSYSELFRTEKLAHGSVSLAIGDVDEDADNEVVWGSGVSSSGKDILVVADVVGGTVESWSNEEPSQLDSFRAAGPAEIAPGEQRMVFVVPTTESGYGGQRVVQMDLDGSYEVSVEVNTNWDDAFASSIADYDNDGYDEIILATASFYDGQLDVIQLNNFMTDWTNGPGDYDDGYSVVVNGDLNNDGRADAVTVNGSRISAIDLYNQVLLWDSATFQYRPEDLAVGDLTGDGWNDIVMSSRTETSLWVRNAGLSGYVRQTTAAADIGCSRVLVAEVDDSAGLEVICLSYESDFYASDSTLRIYDADLSLLREINLPYNIQDIAVVPSTHRVYSLYVAAAEGNCRFGCVSGSVIRQLSLVTGDTVWESPALLGNISGHDLHVFYDDTGRLRMSFATSNAMYLSQ